MQGSDFVMTFYPVGKLLMAGRAAEIYPPPGVANFVEAPFNKYVHQLLTFLNPQYVAIYMYSPLMACLFWPFALGTPTEALVSWQLFSIFVLAVCAWVLAQNDRGKACDYFFMFSLFCPVFHTLLIGHLGIVVGLLPLVLGYMLLNRSKELAGGFAWGALLLKPQFLPAAMLVAGSLLFAGRPRAAIGFAAGLLFFGLVSCFALGPQLFSDWLQSFKMSDTIFAHAGYGFPAYMVVSLPAVLLQSFPFEQRGTAKIFIYGLAALIGLFSLYRSTGILRAASKGDSKIGAAEPGDFETNAGNSDGKPSGELSIEQKRRHRGALSLVMLIALLVLPLVLPHFLFYDMCGLSIIGAIAFQGYLVGAEAMRVRQIRSFTWWACNLYFVSFMFLPVAPLGHWYALILVAFFALMLRLVPGFIKGRVEEDLSVGSEAKASLPEADNLSAN